MYDKALVGACVREQVFLAVYAVTALCEVIVSDSLAELTKAWERVDPRRKIAGELTALRLAAYSLKDSKIVTADDIDIVSANVTDILDRILQFGQEHPECDGALDQIADIVQDFYDHVCQNRGECTVQLPGRSV
eukprot:GHVQ01011312.1.p1 GENE.GHVQ01011312.1~~GHVQ01011312.1.p1  ORF type:complete len:134 (-),score=6.59 GHVQ01011312.1:442-843(-)